MADDGKQHPGASGHHDQPTDDIRQKRREARRRERETFVMIAGVVAIYTAYKLLFP